MNKLKQPVLTVIVPVYNAKKFLKKCIDSIRQQIYENLEIILINDGSTDGSKEICDEYVKADKRIHVIHQENRGPLETRYVGVEEARGKYVTFVDSDDWIAKEMYIKLIGVLESSHADIVISGIYRYWNENEMEKNNPQLMEGIYTRKDIEEKIIPVMIWNVKRGRCGVDPSLCSKIYKREFLRKHVRNAKDLRIHYGEDICILYPMLLEANTIAVLRESYYYHRQRTVKETAPYIEDSLFFEKLYVLYQYLKKIFKKNVLSLVLLKQLEYLYMFLVQSRHDYHIKMKEILDYSFPDKIIPNEAKVVLYGAGEMGQAYKEQNDRYHFCNIVLWVDKQYRNFDRNMMVYSPEKIKKCNYDCILIGVKIPELAEEIKNELIQMGVERKKIIWRVISTYELL